MSIVIKLKINWHEKSINTSLSIKAGHLDRPQLSGKDLKEVV